MSFRTAEKTLAPSPVATRFGCMLLLVLAGVCLSKGANAASDTIVDCDRLETSLRSLEVATDDLDGVQEDTQSAPPVSTTPILLLGPRASSISREVFDALPIDTLDEGSNESDTTNSLPETHDAAPSAPPIVKYPLITDRPASSIQDDQSDSDPANLSRFQRRMYRTDI